MPDAMLHDLAWSLLDFVHLDADMIKLGRTLRRAAPRLPRCRDAAKRLQEIRGQLRQLHLALDAEIAEATKYTSS